MAGEPDPTVTTPVRPTTPSSVADHCARMVGHNWRMYGAHRNLGADSGDMTTLRRCVGSVLDIGCGPGLLVVALTDLGHPAMGIDVCPIAVARTVRSGGAALRRSVFDWLPNEGRWDTALLIDGNVGIGGDPHALLERVARLVSGRGLLLVETAPADVDERHRVRLDDGHGGLGSPFWWAAVGLTAMLRRARETGWAAAEHWTARGRTFVALRRAP
ncbi:methyltransferase domain-containing protein [Streptomyces sp. H27-D2]|uniref:methyltransferase domain-containing protein n=1 Tax=Streptomyces sp. H27-D2 TaxID=3046304 RepID=UPI002DB972FD|nr:methyltransferase domain-containing protein [Streptomyces sp. H27-D2]MEC4019415.1 methyltransferase domain-containing protein [Streptomyces sp. H27-D2]